MSFVCVDGVRPHAITARRKGRKEGRGSPTHHVMNEVNRIDAVRRVCLHVGDDVDALAVRAELVRVVRAPFDDWLEFGAHSLRCGLVLAMARWAWKEKQALK